MGSAASKSSGKKAKKKQLELTGRHVATPPETKERADQKKALAEKITVCQNPGNDWTMNNIRMSPVPSPKSKTKQKAKRKAKPKPKTKKSDQVRRPPAETF